MTDIDAPIAKLDHARRLLAEARSVDEVKQVRDVAEQMRLYARAVGLSLEAQNNAAEIKLRAERRAGELLAAMPKNQGGYADGVLPDVTPPTLSDMGVSRRQSSDWQAIASIPETAFEAHVAETKDADEPVTTRGAVKLARQIQQRQDAEDVEAVIAAIDDGEIERQRLLLATWKALGAVDELVFYDVHMVADGLTDVEWLIVAEHRQALIDWFDRLDAARVRAPTLVTRA